MSSRGKEGGRPSRPSVRALSYLDRTSNFEKIKLLSRAPSVIAESVSRFFPVRPRRARESGRAGPSRWSNYAGRPLERPLSRNELDVTERARRRYAPNRHSFPSATSNYRLELRRGKSESTLFPLIETRFDS